MCFPHAVADNVVAENLSAAAVHVHGRHASRPIEVIPVEEVVFDEEEIRRPEGQERGPVAGSVPVEHDSVGRTLEGVVVDQPMRPGVALDRPRIVAIEDVVVDAQILPARRPVELHRRTVPVVGVTAHEPEPGYIHLAFLGAGIDRQKRVTGAAIRDFGSPSTRTGALQCNGLVRDRHCGVPGAGSCRDRHRVAVSRRVDGCLHRRLGTARGIDGGAPGRARDSDNST